MSPRHVTAVTHNFVTYGHVWHDPDLGWVGSKTGEFDTERAGFDTESAAAAWVLTNGGLHIPTEQQAAS